MKKILIITAVFLAIVVIAMSALTFFLTFQFPEGTTAFNTDISNMSNKTAAEEIQAYIDSYTLTLNIDGNPSVLTAWDLSLTFDTTAIEDLAAAYQEANAETVSVVLDNTDYLSMDTASIEALLEQQFSCQVVEAEGPQLQWNEETGAFQLQGGSDGEYTDIAPAVEAVVESIYRLDSSITLTEADYRVSFTDSEKTAAAQAAMESANALVACQLTYTFYPRSGVETIEVIDNHLIGSWLTIGEDGLSVTLDETLIEEYAQTMAETYGNEEGEGYFMSHNGEEINLPATMPANLVDAQALYEDIYTCLSNQESGDREAPYSVQAAYKNFDGTYIEISISEQKLRAYLDGELFADTDIITGCLHCDHGTVTGVFKIQNHGRNLWLQENYFVNYWMGFHIPKYGLHDADHWRTEEEYGGDTYLTDGSGGCVNVPGEVISQMYETFDNGVPVIIYDDTYLLSQQNTEPVEDA